MYASRVQQPVRRRNACPQGAPATGSASRFQHDIDLARARASEGSRVRFERGHAPRIQSTGLAVLRHPRRQERFGLRRSDALRWQTACRPQEDRALYQPVGAGGECSCAAGEPAPRGAAGKLEHRLCLACGRRHGGGPVTNVRGGQTLAPNVRVWRKRSEGRSWVSVYVTGTAMACFFFLSDGNRKLVEGIRGRLPGVPCLRFQGTSLMDLVGHDWPAVETGGSGSRTRET